MSKVKIIAVLSTLLILLALLVGAFYVEFGLIPQVLAQAGYQGAVVTHVVVTLLMLAITAVLSAWLSGQTIYKVQEKLVASHLNNLTDAIAHVVSGAWTNQANVEKTVFMAGARLGYDVRDQVPPVERGEVLSGLAAMQLPEPKKLLGDKPEVIDEMSTYLNTMDRRKERLSR